MALLCSSEICAFFVMVASTEKIVHQVWCITGLMNIWRRDIISSAVNYAVTCLLIMPECNYMGKSGFKKRYDGFLVFITDLSSFRHCSLDGQRGAPNLGVLFIWWLMGDYGLNDMQVEETIVKRIGSLLFICWGADLPTMIRNLHCHFFE